MTQPLVIQTVAIRRVVVGDTRAIRAQRTNRLSFTPEDGSSPTLYVPYSPREVAHSGIGSDYERVNRAGRTDALLWIRKQLPMMAFSLFISDQTIWDATVGGPVGGGIPRIAVTPIGEGYHVVSNAMVTIQKLRTYAELGTRLRIAYGLFESGVWRITSMTVQGEQRDSATNEISQATLEMEFTRVSDVVVGIGPVTGGVQPPPTTTPPPTSQPSRTYTVKRGDTLWGISIKYYGTGVHWKRIADANGVRDPRKLQIGKVLRIP